MYWLEKLFCSKKGKRIVLKNGEAYKYVKHSLML